jgi:hypothetical protein
MQDPDNRLRKAAEYAEKIRTAVVRLVASDAAAAADTQGFRQDARHGGRNTQAPAYPHVHRSRIGRHPT